MEDNLKIILNEIENLANLNRFEEAFAKLDNLIKHNKKNPLFLNIRGVIRLRTNEFDLAITDFNKAIKIQPIYSEAHSNLGVAFRQVNKIDLAINSFKKSIALDETNIDALLNLGATFFSLSRFFEAISLFEKVIKIQKENISSYLYLGACYLSINKVEEALKFFLDGLKFNNKAPQLFIGVGNCYKYLRKKEKAIEAYLNAFKLDKNNIQILYSLSDLNYSFSEEQILFLQNLANHENHHQYEYINFALFNFFNSRKDYDTAFFYLKKANDYLKNKVFYNHNASIEFPNKVKNIFNFIQKHDFNSEKVDKKLIFIIGMPRSGTSLLEQVLSSNNEIYAAGELKFIPSEMSSLFFKQTSAKQILKKLNEIKKNYLEIISNLTSKSIIVDKMPTNYFYIGFISRMFPNSKIIHINREPIATCFSNYKIFFESEQMQFTCDLEFIKDNYRIYEDLIKFWKTKGINNLLHIKYEDLTENPKKYFNLIFDFLEIDFNESFLNLENSSRAVTTASSNQVGNKIYKGSSEDWLHYKKHLFLLIKEFT